MVTDENISELISELKRVRGLDLAGYRQGAIQRWLAARMIKIGCNSTDEYLETLRDTLSECDNLIDTIGVNLSDFFRDTMVWEILKQSLLPAITEKK